MKFSLINIKKQPNTKNVMRRCNIRERNKFRSFFRKLLKEQNVIVVKLLLRVKLMETIYLVTAILRIGQEF